MRTFVLAALLSTASCKGCHDRDSQIPPTPPRETEGTLQTATSERERALADQARATTAGLEDKRAVQWIDIADSLFAHGKYVRAANEYSRAADAYRRLFDKWKKTTKRDIYFQAIADLAEARAVRKKLVALHISLDQSAESRPSSDPSVRALARIRAEILDSDKLTRIDRDLDTAGQATKERRYDAARPLLDAAHKDLVRLVERFQKIVAEEESRKG